MASRTLRRPDWNNTVLIAEDVPGQIARLKEQPGGEDGTLPQAFRLLDTKVSTTGVAIQRYERAGGIEYGAFEVDERGHSEALWSKER